MKIDTREKALNWLHGIRRKALKESKSNDRAIAKKGFHEKQMAETILGLIGEQEAPDGR